MLFRSVPGLGSFCNSLQQSSGATKQVSHGSPTYFKLPMPNTPRGMALFIPVILQRKEIKGSARLMNVKTTDDSAFRIYLYEALSVDLIATSIILECLALLLQNFERNSTSKTVPFTARLLSDEFFERTKPSDPFLCRFLHESIALLKQHA